MAGQARAAAQLQRVADDGLSEPWQQLRGLVVLVEYEDCPFSRDDYYELVDSMFNDPDFSGYYDESGFQWCTGSVYSYFRENSFGALSIHYDVCEPVQVPFSQYDMMKHDGVGDIFGYALFELDSTIDFSQYDADGDGEIDMLFFIVSGGGSNYAGNDERLLWPHQGYWRDYLDGKLIGSYACSTELAGNSSHFYLDGIGTICHETSHVLGLPDFYDTDYAGSGGLSQLIGNWSVMCTGAYTEYSRTPAGYTLLERWLLSYAWPEKIISPEGTYELQAINTSNEGYFIWLPFSDYGKFFTLENRQRTRWDRGLPGSGMLVFSVDFSDDDYAWSYNRVNADPSHNHYQLVRGRYPGERGGQAMPFLARTARPRSPA